MFTTVLSATLRGLCVEFVHVEADASNGLPVFHMVGYLSSEVKEAGERVRTAIQNSGMNMPAKKIIINLSPANMRKKGTMFDLPIAVAILGSLGKVELKELEDTLMVGELSLNGMIKHVPGVLPIVMEAKKRGCKRCIVPKENQKEGELVEGIQLIGVESLEEVCKMLEKGLSKEPVRKISKEGYSDVCLEAGGDYSEVCGQRVAKRAAEIAVAGNHNMLMVGPPGAGKSMIAKRIPSILPPLSREESMELTMIYSIVGGLDTKMPLIRTRPFREVHHTVTKTALVGGGHVPRPGEISLAHKGVLFLDEIAEFQKPVLELLRQPLEEHQIRILREQGEYLFPAEFLLVAAMNPCPCGNYPNRNECSCTEAQIHNYLGKISQPLLDRIDICIEVEKVNYDDLQSVSSEESSSEIRKRVCKARQIQKERNRKYGILTNAQLQVKNIEEICQLGWEEEEMMRHAFERMNLTARSYYKVLGVARTIADLNGAEKVNQLHLKEALSYRMIDKKYWGRSDI